MYDDKYATCHHTYATLRIYPGEMDPITVTERLRIEPSQWQRRGEAMLGRGPRAAPINGWFLESRGQVESRDSRRHVDWLLDRLESKGEVIRALQEEGCSMDVFCYWCSQGGNGGPMVSPAQMKRLGELNIELGFDIYGPYGEDDA